MSEILPSEILPKDLWSSVTPIPDLDAKIFAELKSKDNIFRNNILIDNYPEYKDLYSYTEESDTYLQRAYYATVMAGEEGLALVKEHGLQRAGEIIYAASRGDGTHPNLGKREYWLSPPSPHAPFSAKYDCMGFNNLCTLSELRKASGAKSKMLPKSFYSSVTPIPDLDAKILAALEGKDYADTIFSKSWERYDAARIAPNYAYLRRAYYATVMAGEEGFRLAEQYGLEEAGQRIYAASRGDGTHPNLGEREYWHPFLVNWEFNYSDTRAELRQATGAKSFFEQAKEALAKLRKPEAKDDLKASVDKPTEGTSKHLRMKWNNG
jgi:hypothetical protein